MDVDQLEGRVVLSSTSLAVASSSGTYGGTTNLLAHLTSGANNVSGEIIDFQLGGQELGTALTDANGLAFINNVSLTGVTSFNVGTFTNAVTAEFTGDAGAGFTGSSGAANLTVTTAPLTISANNQTKVYGAPLPTLTASYTGFVNGDTAASLTTPPTITTNATAGSHVSGNPYTIAVSGAVDSNYSISYVYGNLTVTTAPLTISANNQTKVYGAALPTLTASYTGFVNGDTSASLATPPSITTTALASSHVAGSPYNISVSGAVDPDYSISSVTGQLTVTTAPLTITANNQSKVYGAALPTLTASYSGFVNGDTSASITTAPTITTTATAASHVAGGPYAITASGAVETDYAISYVAGNLTVTAAPLTITANDQTKAYGAALPTLTASYSGFVNGDTSASITTAPTITTTATAASHVAGGPYAITAIGAVDPDYTISYVAGNLTVTAVPLTITADDQTKAYGAALPTLSASYSGFVNGDTSASITTAPTITTTATAASHVAGGPYAITASGAVDPDYTISYVDGTLAVTAAPLTIGADHQSKVYGADLPTLTASYIGLVNGDTSASLTTPPTITTTATAASHVAGSPYSIFALGAADTDYSITYVGGNLTVTPAPLTITSDSQTKVYGAALPTLTASYSGLVNGDTAASLTDPVVLSTTATASSAVSAYPITSSGASDADYAITYATGSLAVTPAPLVVTVDNLRTTYGQAVPIPRVFYSGFVNGDTVASLTTPAKATTKTGTSTNAGTYPVIVSGASSNNYSITYTPSLLTVDPATLVVTPTSFVNPYGVAIPPLKLNYAGFVNGDTPASLTTPEVVSTTATKSSDFGSYPITVSGGSSPNYTIVNNQGTLTIPVNPVLNAFVTSVYQQVLGRSPETTALDGWLSQLNNGVSQFSVASQIYNSSEAVSARALKHTSANPNAPARIALVTSLFQNILGRAPEVSGLNGWLTRMNHGESPAQVANDIYNSKEAVKDRASVPPPAAPSKDEQIAAVTALYETTTGRGPDGPSLNGWLAKLDGGENIDQVANEIYTSLKGGSHRVTSKLRLK